MKSQWMLILVLLSVMSLDASAKAKPHKKSKLTTEADFDGSTLHGRYQKSAETLATVESEKAMMDLLGNRKNFKDRLAKTGSER